MRARSARSAKNSQPSIERHDSDERPDKLEPTANLAAIYNLQTTLTFKI